MNVLVMGYRKGICQVLERMDIEYVIWNPKDIKTQRKAGKIVIKDFPKTRQDLVGNLPRNFRVSHVIAGTEESVFPASLARKWLGARRNLLSVAVKCTDKLKMKVHLKEKGIPMTSFLSKKMYVSPDQVIEELGETVVVKPRKSSGGRGLKVVTGKKEISEAISNRTLVEKVIEGSEGSIESIVDKGQILFTNITQYKEVGLCNILPGHYSKKLNSEIVELNKKVIGALKIEWGMTHMEFYSTKDGLLFGEIALRPPGGYIMDTLKVIYDHNFWEFFVRIELGLEVRAMPERKKYGASSIFYPKVGVVEEVIGEQEAMNLISVNRLRVKAKVGREVLPRGGVGEDFGYCIFAHEDRQQLVDDLKAFKKIFKIKTTR